jgi:hypothetical protein
MNFNQIILDILDWIRRSLWTEEIHNKPYQVLDTKIGTTGIIKRVQRDTPRAVATYILTPVHNSDSIKDFTKQKSIKDIHICLDHLWTIELTTHYPQKTKHSIKSRRFSTSGKSHTVTILEASRWLNREGNYSSNVIFTKEYDFLGSDFNATRDKYAIPIITDMANLLLYRNLKTINWEIEIEMSQKRFMGRHYSSKHMQ